MVSDDKYFGTFGDYLRQKREQKGYSVNQLALYSEVSSAQISRIENGVRNTPKPETIFKLAHALHVDPTEMMAAAGYIVADKPGLYEARSSVSSLTEKNRKFIEDAVAKMRNEDAQKAVEVRMIPVLGTIKAGYDLYADQQVIDYKPAATADVSDGEYFYLVVKGDSMIDDGIKEGMRVLVRRQDFVEEGKVGVVLVNGDEATLKRVFYDGDNIILQASNAAYKPRVLPVEEAKIQGQVTQVVWDV
jgi:repressor LexA